MLAALPVASTTTSHMRPSVSRLTASISAGALVASTVSATPIDARTKSSRDWAMSITITRAPATLANSSADRPIGPAPMMSIVSPGFGAARSIAWQPIASVSTSAFCSAVSRGDGWSLRAGTVNSGRSPPSQCTPSVWWCSQQFVSPRTQEWHFWQLM